MRTSPEPASPSPTAADSSRISARLGPTYHKACARSLTCPPTRLPSCYRGIAFGVTLLLPSPLWGGVGGGGRGVWHHCAITSRPPTPTLPHKGGGSRRAPCRVQSPCPLVGLRNAQAAISHPPRSHSKAIS